jgi:predicted esterase
MGNSPNKKSNTKSRIILVIVLILSGLLIWGIRWATYARPPLPEATQALESDDIVAISHDPWLIFTPVRRKPTTGFIFYPGGRIDPKGYALLMRAIASDGYLVIVPKMPINMAVFNANVADEIIDFYPDISLWVIGGHSVGGTMAAQFTAKHPELIDGLTIWASYPANNSNISDYDLSVVSIYGSNDSRVNKASVGKRKHLLPADTLYIRIEGGDHHQFGSYEIRPKEHLATIERAVQAEMIIRGTLELLRRVSENGG